VASEKEGAETGQEATWVERSREREEDKRREEEREGERHLGARGGTEVGQKLPLILEG